ncbi:MAG: hypothetical protein H6613_08170 [Ignavibacteriales bacterium]|nr:hypothetical protein [Ignavibacteriales bacterium]
MLNLKQLIFLFFLAISILLTSCSSSKNEVAEKKKDDKVNLLKKDFAPIPLAPGTAEVKSLVTNIFGNNDKYFCKIKVNEVKQYGPSTKPIAVGSEFELEIPDKMVERLDNSLLNKSEVVMTISYLPSGVGQADSNSWRIIKIND